MLNKKGFTLVEVIITLGLLAIILVFMMNTLVSLKNQDVNANYNKELMITQAILSRAFNKDVVKFGGITTARCPVDNPACTINYSMGNVRFLQISADKRTITYSSGVGVVLKRTLSEEFQFGAINKENYNYASGSFVKIVIPIYELSEEFDESENNSQIISKSSKYSIEIYSYLKN